LLDLEEKKKLRTPTGDSSPWLKVVESKDHGAQHLPKILRSRNKDQREEKAGIQYLGLEEKQNSESLIHGNLFFRRFLVKPT
jgi:hypothetical protein